MAIEFRPLREDDLPQLHDWLQVPCVHAWWGATSTPEETAAFYGPSLRGEDPAEYSVIVVDGRDVGLFEANGPQVDLLIGEEALIGRGLWPEILRAFLAGRPGAYVALVDEENPRAWRAFEKAGFRHAGNVVEEGRPHRLLRVER